MTEQQIKEKIEKAPNSQKSALVSQALALLEKIIPAGSPFYSHSLRVAFILVEMGGGEKTISAGVLHQIPLEKIRLNQQPQEAAKEVKTIIKKANRLRHLFNSYRRQKTAPLKKWRKIFLNQQGENVRRMFFALSRDLRPIFLTLAGRLDELKNLSQDYSPEEKTKKAAAALEILAPLAYGIGMGEIKGRLEDAAFPLLYPKEYQWLKEHIKASFEQRKNHLEETKPAIKEILEREGLQIIKIDARSKHYFSLYQKLLRYDMDLDKIYDLIAMRVILPDIESCYLALGIIHNQWQPLYGRIKDYIACPKANGYRSLHTTVVCPDCGDFMEIQIKTPQMHREAEYGAAAHLNYKRNISQKEYEHQFYWLETLRKWREEVKDPQKIAGHLRQDLFKDKIFTFTPKGDVIDLPKGSTPIDFAYAVHSDVGEHCQGAKVNAKMVSLKKNLKNGDVVEILTSSHQKPSSDWLKLARTNKAKARIRHFLEKAYGYSLAKPGKAIKEKVSLISKMLPGKRKKKENQVLIAGQTGIQIKLAKCCKPGPDDEIIGFITQGQGASVHKVNCLEFKKLKQKQPERIVQANWQNN